MVEPKIQTKTDDFGYLLKEYFAKVPQTGDLVKGEVISIDRGEVRVDVNGIIVGVVRGEELFGESREFSDVKVGDSVEATVVEEENENGEMELSFRVAGHKMVWARMAQFQKEGTSISAKVLQANKGGLMLKIDALIGFLPVSQLNPDHYPRVQGGDKNRILDHIKQFIGKNLTVKVLDVNEADEKLILSEKVVWEDAQKSIIESYKIGDVVDGEISALTPFGAFMKFGDGLEGLIHISEIVWQRISHPKDVLNVGKQVEAQIIDLNRSKIYLSLKRLVEDPWKRVKDNYKVGDIVEGEIHKIEPFGLMVKLDDEIHGLAHISDLSSGHVRDAKVFLQDFKVGDRLKFEIISMEPAEHRLGLRLEGVKNEKKTPNEAVVPKAEEKLSGEPQKSAELEKNVAQAENPAEAVVEKNKAVEDAGNPIE